MADPRYFDHAASTPLDPRVLEEVFRAYRLFPGNAHAVHSAGREARNAVETTREQVARAIGAEDPLQIIFTSGATEANETVIRAHRGAISPFEHSAVRAAATGYEVLENVGYDLVARQDCDFLSVMSVHNETGARWDVRSLPAKLRHADMTQSLGKEAVDVTGLDFASFSAHKLNGPKGVGAIFAAAGSVEPLLRGGGQEQGNRGGTLNVPAIVGFGVAAEIAADEWPERANHAAVLREQFLSVIPAEFAVTVNGGPNPVPHILSLSFAGIEGESIVLGLDEMGFAVSAGAACSSGSTEVSPSLRALGLPDEVARGTIRISFGLGNTAESTDELAKSLVSTVRRLRSLHT